MRAKLPKLIGVIHLPALPGAPGAKHLHPSTALQVAGSLAVTQAVRLVRAGFDGIMIENFGDVPFYRDQVPPETIAAMSIVAAAVREAVPRAQLGINVLRNDGRAALAIASIVGADFIRVNVLSGVAATDQGMIEGKAAELLRERDRLGSEIKILADAHVKHARSISSDDLGLALEELALRAGAEGVIITGTTTGRAVDASALEIACQTARIHRIPLFIGSGVTAESLAELRPLADGLIVGSALRRGGRAGADLDLSRVGAFVKAFRAAGTSTPRKAKAAPIRSSRGSSATSLSGRSAKRRSR